MPRINPFRPNSPVNPGMFVGRVDELDKLEAHLLQTRAGQPINFMITGERGIGKTSLLDYIKYVARGSLEVSSEKLNFLVVETDLDERTSQLALVKKIELGLRHELAKSEKARSFLATTWRFLERVEAAGVSVKERRPPDSDLMVEEFAYSLAETVTRITDRSGEDLFSATYDGLLLLIDEADNACSDLELGSFIKLLVERLQRHDCQRMMVGLAGLPELRQILLASHPSSLRVFEELPLGRLSDEEVRGVIDICIDTANKQNAEQTSVTDAAKASLVNLAEGYPHFIQQFGYSAFAADTDNTIDKDDVAEGAFGKRGALEVIGNRYYRNDFYNKIQKDSYRQVLRVMARKGDAWVTKAEIKKEFHGQESTLDNAIHALRARHIILPREGYKGVYRLQHRGFALWITLYASKQSGNGEIKVDHVSVAPHTAALRGAKTPKPAAPMANP